MSNERAEHSSGLGLPAGDESMRRADITGVEPALACRDLIAGYGDLEVVHGFSLHCEAAQIVAVIGPNGCGKSTMLKRLAGILPSKGGKVQIGGVDCTGESARRLSQRGFHYVPQSRDIFPSLTVLENLKVGTTDSSRLADVLAEFDRLSPILRRKAGRLSGGERKYLAIARAFMRPGLKVLVLDEPSAGLSANASEQLWRLIGACAGRGVGIIVVEQAVDAVLRVADYAYVMVGGRNAAEGGASTLARDVDLGKLFLGL